MGAESTRGEGNGVKFWFRWLKALSSLEILPHIFFFHSGLSLIFVTIRGRRNEAHSWGKKSKIKASIISYCEKDNWMGLTQPAVLSASTLITILSLSRFHIYGHTASEFLLLHLGLLVLCKRSTGMKTSTVKRVYLPLCVVPVDSKPLSISL